MTSSAPLVVLLALAALLGAEDVFLLSAETQSDKPRAFISSTRPASAGAFANSVHIDASSWAPRSIEYYPDLGLVAMAGDGPDGPLVTLRSMLFPRLSAAYADRGMMPLGAKLARVNEDEWGWFYARILKDGDRQDVTYQLMLLGDRQPTILPITGDLPLRKLVNLGSTAQQGLPASMELQPSGATYASVIGPERRSYPIALELPELLASLAASGDVAGPIYWCGADRGLHVLVAKRKSGSFAIFAAGLGAQPMFIERASAFGGLRLIRDWIYIQDLGLSQRAPADIAKRKFTHVFWRPRDGRMIEAAMTGDAEVLDIADSRSCLVRTGARVLVGRFDADKAGPMPVDVVYDGPHAGSVHWGSISLRQ